LANLCHGDYSKYPLVARMQTWRRLRHRSMPSAVTLCSTPTHIYQSDATSNHSHPALFLVYLLLQIV